MRQNYNSSEYWESLIIKNKTIRGHMLMDKMPTDKSLYVHSLIFCKGNGLNNVWSYFPDLNALIGYIQYSFLQEAFYIWINGKKDSVSYIPLKPVEDIIRDGEKTKKITKVEAEKMRKHLKMIKRCWELPRNKVFQELKRFVRDFNRSWQGDSTEFLYLKIFDTAEELGQFVLQSSYMSSSEEDFKKKTSEDISTWNKICQRATLDKECGEKFKNILQKNLTEVI